MPDNRITAVLFDLGDTILNFGRVNTTRAFLQGARATHAYLREHAQHAGAFPCHFVLNLVRLRLRYVMADITHRDFNSREVLQTVGARKGVKLSPQQWEQFAWLWYEPLSRCAQVEEDIQQTLEKLQSLGLKLGIVSNTFVSRFSLEKHLQMLGILGFFTMQLYSHEVDVRKPSREIFRIAAERIGEPVTKILVVGDRIDNDIKPALENGMTAVLKEAYTNTGKNPPPGTLRVRRLSELPALIKSLNSAAKTGNGNP